MRYFGLYSIVAFIKGVFVNDVNRFEKRFAEYIGSDYAIATSFGRTALYLGLKALGVKGKEVIIPSFTCTVVRQAVINAGAKPIFVDLQCESFDFEMADLRQKTNSSTKAILITHYYGRVATNLEEILFLGKEKGITIIEDCAHSLGAEFKNQKIGTYGDLAIFSLTKGLINFGGGVLVTNNKRIYCDAKNNRQAEQHAIKRKIADFPLILVYGFEQMIDKLIFDTIKKSIFKWWLIKVPNILLLFRRYSLRLLNDLLFFFKKKTERNNTLSNNNLDLKHPQSPYPVEMASVIASVAEKQLEVIDQLICERRKVYNRLQHGTKYFFSYKQDSQINEVYTNIVFHFKGKNIMKIISYCKEHNLLLRSTWPTHQKLWLGQQTKVVEKFKDEILVWNVNPTLTDRDIDTFIDLINEIPCEN
jgi:dTDP-4-amino-4,6-dideoxygalactose transaminase